MPTLILCFLYSDMQIYIGLLRLLSKSSRNYFGKLFHYLQLFDYFSKFYEDIDNLRGKNIFANLKEELITGIYLC